MADARISYATTSDGANIAYTITGAGPTVVHMPEQPFSNQLLWPKALPETYSGMNQRFRTVRYDVRGSGMSDRDVKDFSLGAMLRDLEAVVDVATEGPFALIGQFDSVPVAVTFAANHPERLSHLVLVDGYTSFADYEQGQALGIERAVREQDWNLSTEIVAGVLAGFEGDEAKSYAEYIRACVDSEHYAASQQAIEAYDIRELAGLVAAPTLVVHTTANRWLPVDVGRRLAARIPNSQLALVDDALIRGLPAMLQEFMSLPQEPSSNSHLDNEPSVRTVLFTDVVGHTAIMQRLGDERGRDVLREHERITREALTRHGGAEVKTMGDGFMASFASVTRALDCAVSLQQAFSAREGEPLRVRIGVNAGEPIAEDDDLFGTSVIATARIAAMAGGGQVLVSDVVRQLVAGKGFLFSDTGDHVLKGMEDPVRVWELSWREIGPR